MQLTVLIPGALVPGPLAAELAAALRAPRLAARLPRATPAAAGDHGGDDGWLATHLFGVAGAAPTAPYAWAELGGATDANLTVWQAEPAHVLIGRDSLVLQDIGPPLDAAQADALIAEANAALEGTARIERLGDAWFLHAQAAWSLAQRAWSRAVGRALPVGVPDAADARAWARRLNEIQMRWHTSEVNAAREAQGWPPANSLWLHGGGRWASEPALPFAAVHSDRAALRGLARARGAVAADAAAAPVDRALLVWDDVGDAARRGDWHAWVAGMQRIDDGLGALHAFAGATIDFVLTSDEAVRTLRSAPADRWAFWRRASLAQALAA
jgi:hypothetical protein